MNFGIDISLWIRAFVFFGYVPRSRIAGSYLVLFLVFWGTSVLFSTAAIPTSIPTNSVQGLPFPHFLANIGYLWSLWWQSFGQVWADFSLWFWLSFLWWLMMWVSFHVPIGQKSVFFGKKSIQVLCPFSIVFC